MIVKHWIAVFIAENEITSHHQNVLQSKSNTVIVGLQRTESQHNVFMLQSCVRLVGWLVGGVVEVTTAFD
jgi:hypothetical protein